jgi:hypothetical protein
MKPISLSVYVLLLAQSIADQRGGFPPKTDTESARCFVQSFYDWYVPKGSFKSLGPTSDRALRTKSSFFSPKLIEALREDSAAQSRAKGEIVGLDFDPFLNSQDPDAHYSVGKVTHQGSSYIVSVYGVTPGKRPSSLAVIAKLEKHRGKWRFSNFIYPNGSDLLAVLHALSLERHHH